MDLDRRALLRVAAGAVVAPALAPRARAPRGGAAAAAAATADRDGAPLRVRRVLRGFGQPRYAAIAPRGAHGS